MQVIKSLIGAASLALSVCGAANATVITDTYNPPDVKITTSSPFEYQHDLRHYGLPGATVEWARLSVVLRDPSLNFLEKVTFNFESEQTKVIKNVKWKGEKFNFGLMTSLLDDGILSVKISVGCTNIIIACLPQNVWFAKSTLETEITPWEPTPVPEPATLLSLGAGLLGLGAMRRRAARKSMPGQGAASAA